MHLARVTTLGELAASIAHEVNQPIAGTLASAQAALRWLGAETPNLDKARESLDRIIRDSARAGAVVRRRGAAVTLLTLRSETIASRLMRPDETRSSGLPPIFIAA